MRSRFLADPQRHRPRCGLSTAPCSSKGRFEPRPSTAPLRAFGERRRRPGGLTGGTDERIAGVNSSRALEGHLGDAELAQLVECEPVWMRRYFERADNCARRSKRSTGYVERPEVEHDQRCTRPTSSPAPDAPTGSATGIGASPRSNQTVVDRICIAGARASIAVREEIRSDSGSS